MEFDDVTSLAAMPAGPRITGARFVPIQHRDAAMTVHVFAQNLAIHGAPLFARVGRHYVHNLVPAGRGRGFSGILKQMPSPGDRLYVQYLGRLEHKTNVVYQGGGGNQNVA
jgi:hypothetical protein